MRALNLVHTRKRNFKAEDLAKMTKLLYLVLDGCTVGGNFGSSLEELRWLQWRKMPSMQPPLMLDLFNLTSLDFSYSSNLASLWTESSPALEVWSSLVEFGTVKGQLVALYEWNLEYLCLAMQVVGIANIQR